MGHDYTRIVEDLKELKMSDKEKPTPPERGIVKEDMAEATATIKAAQVTRGTDGDLMFSDILTSFIYVLLSDYMTAGQVEKAIRSVYEGDTVIFTDSFLAQYADNLANTLKNAKVSALASALEKAFIEKSPPEQSSETKKSRGEARLGDDDEALAQLQERVDEAIENMNEEDEKVWKERESDVLEEVSRNNDVGLKVKPSDNSSFERDIIEKVNKAEWRTKSSEDLQNDDETTNEKHVEEADDREYPDQIASSLAALESIKELVPTDTIRQVADILKQEVENELVDEEESPMTREEILLQQAAKMQEHKATNPEAEKMAEEYVKEQLEQHNEPEDVEDELPLMSRGNLKDVRHGKAFPEALSGVFDDPAAEMNKAISEDAQKKIVEIEASENKPRTGVFQRVK